MPPTSSTLQTFIAMYVVGNFICLTATGFLLGPAAQWGKMWAETRRFSTAFYLAMLIIVFAVAIAVSYNQIVLSSFCLIDILYLVIETKCLFGTISFVH